MRTSQEMQAMLIGGGAVAIEFHLPRLLAVLGATQVEIVESDPSRCAELARRFRRDQRIEVVMEPDFGRERDLVIIATPPKFHADYFHAVSTSARGVVIEKPVAIDQGIGLAISSGGPTVWVNLLRRCLTSFRLLRDLWLEQRFGALESVEFHEGSVYAWEAASLGSFSKELNGGGVLMDTGPHVLDSLLQVFDDLSLEQAWIDGEARGIEANATLALFGDGVPVTVQMSRNRKLSNSAVFEFEQARCRIGVCEDQIAVTTRTGSEFTIRSGAGDSFTPVPTFADLFDRFYVEKLLANDNAGVGIDESIAALRVIEAAYAIADPMRGGF
ncbi:MAG: Gfo/Idh/MocA family oxidoreductase [Deltaproteobacteria bacterium]|nr:Gfo/Idh/MocA family oxidoreductase [Deltaproteobacteria bacterium]